MCSKIYIYTVLHEPSSGEIQVIPKVRLLSKTISPILNDKIFICKVVT